MNAAVRMMGGIPNCIFLMPTTHTLHRKNLGFCRLQDGSPWIEIEICLKHHKKLGSVKCLIFCTSNSLPLFGQGTKIAMPLYTKLI